MFALVPEKDCDFTKFKWVTVKPGGYKPLPMSSVGYTSAPNGKAYCFGGVMDLDEDEENLKGKFGDELLALDLAAQTWRLLEITKKSKTSKSNSSASADTKMETETATVTTDGVFTVTVAGPSNAAAAPAEEMPSLFPNRRTRSSPSPRMKPGLCVCKGTLYLFGGVYEEDDKQFTYNDFYALDLHKLDEWRVLVANDLNSHDWIDSESSDSEEDDSESDGEEDDEESESEMDTD